MNALETLAIAKLVSDGQEKKARTGVNPGTHDADFWVHITGGMEVGEDYTRRVPQKARPWSLVAVALSHLNGVTVESIVREALEMDPELEKAIKEQAEKAVGELKGPTETTCAGRIKADLTAEVVYGQEAIAA